MRFTVLTDLHIHPYQEFDQDGSRLANCLDVLRKVFSFSNKNGITHILFSGDLYDSQRMLPVKAVNKTVSTFKKLFEKYPHIMFIAISGNHDQGSKNLYHRPADTALTHLSEMFDNFRLIDGGLPIQLEPGLAVHGIPYYEYPEHYALRLKEASELLPEIGEQKNILMLHQTPKGIANDFIPFDTDPNDPLYAPFDLILCGHIHSRQQLNDKFFVVGSPLHRDREDEGEDKGFMVFDSEDWGFGFISLSKYYPAFITLPQGAEAPPNAYVNRLPNTDHIAVKSEGGAEITRFSVANSRAELVENFWLEVDGKDRELLEIGLSTLKLLPV